ncbi:MAG: hypothetical protein D3904_12670 [Candidatus Electrothrix sp. EH2]|nr:hypothetical protein [Candidatus Electrothrix sp. EH2]
MKIFLWNNRKKRNIVSMAALLTCLSAGTAFAITTDSSTLLSAEELAEELAGTGVSVSNASLICPSGAFGTFSDGMSAVGIENGIIMSTGSIDDVVGPNDDDYINTEYDTAGDPDLTDLAGGTTRDACVLEFDFQVDPDPELDSLVRVKFDYVFASDEYNEFVDYFNDGFAFFADGENIALIPETTVPVSINTVNSEDYSEFYINNDDCQDDPANCPVPDTQMDGLTTVLSTAEVEVVPGDLYHLKLAIADTYDTAIDSNLFLDKDSLTILYPVTDCKNPDDVEGADVDVTGIILTRNFEENRDDAQFKLKNVTGIKEAAYQAVAAGMPLTFRFGETCEEPIYERTVSAEDLNVTYLNMRYTEGNLDVVRCVFSSEECVINLEGDHDNEALDELLTGEMRVTLQVGDAIYTNTGIWTQYNSGSGSWTKYRKDK